MSTITNKARECVWRFPPSRYDPSHEKQRAIIEATIRECAAPLVERLRRIYEEADAGSSAEDAMRLAKLLEEIPALLAAWDTEGK